MERKDEEFQEHLAEAEASSGSNLPVPLDPPAERPSLIRLSPAASFVSQLIAEKHNLQPQRAKRRGSVDSALDAYSTGASISVLRMPQGYRKTVVV